MSTKWEILEARRDEYLAQAATIQRMLDSLEKTPCGVTCHRCDAYLRTEKDFAQHYLIPDARYLNIGDCPNRKW